VGLPFTDHRAGVTTTGGKDLIARRLRVGAVFDDHAGICAACAAVGIYPYVIRTPQVLHARRDTPAFNDFSQAAASFLNRIRDPQERQLVVQAGQNVREPLRKTSYEYRFSDAKDAPAEVLFRPVPQG
jgi:hypothetical protein